MQQFEYYVLDLNPSGMITLDIDWVWLSKKLNSLGEEGWELVSDLSIDSNGFSKRARLIFKRPKE